MDLAIECLEASDAWKENRIDGSTRGEVETYLVPHTWFWRTGTSQGQRAEREVAPLAEENTRVKYMGRKRKQALRQSRHAQM